MPRLSWTTRRRATTDSSFALILCAICLMLAGSFQPASAASNYSQDFSTNPPPNWSTRSYDGVQTFTATGGYYANDNHNTLYSIATYDADTWTTGFTYAVDLYSQYGGGPANAVGAIYGYQDPSNYYEVWFNMQGEADLYRVSGGAKTQVAHSTSFSMTSSTWFTVQIVRNGTNTTVNVNGTALFTNISQPEITTPGKIGVIAEWDAGRFDNVAVTLSGYSQNFNTNTAPGWSTASYDGVQTFTATGGYYTNDNHNTLWSIAKYDGASWLSNFTYSVDLNSQYGGGTANAVGAIYGYQDNSNYYKVWFNMKGEADLYRVSGGTATQVAHTTSFSMTANTWFTVLITRSGSYTSVSVNGTPLFTNISQPEITTPGKIGVIAEWDYGLFDNVVVSNATTTLYATDGPPFPRLGGIRIGNPFDYDDSSVQHEIAKVHVAILNYWKGWNTSTRSMDQVVQNIKSFTSFPQYPTKVFLYVNNSELSTDPSLTNTELTNQLNARKWWLYSDSSRTTRVHDPLSDASKPVYLANSTSNVAKDPVTNQDWTQWYATWVYNNYFKPNPSIDGFFMDILQTKPLADGDWYANGVVVSASDPAVSATYRAGMREHFDTLAPLMPGKYQIGNIGDWGDAAATYPEYSNMINGGVLEAYIGKSWSLETWSTWDVMMSDYRKVMGAVMAPKWVIFNQWGDLTDYRSMRYGLASCLMDDGYYSFTDNVAQYGSIPQFDEFTVALGYPIEPPPTAAWQNGVWRRNYQNGTVLVNPKGNNGGNPVTVTLEPGYKHFTGTQDPSTNNGAAVTTLTLQARDGVVLVRSP